MGSGKKWKVGFELGFLKDRITFHGYYPKNRTGNQLVDYNLLKILVYYFRKENLREQVQNTGFEFPFFTVNIQTKNFH